MKVTLQDDLKEALKENLKVDVEQRCLITPAYAQLKQCRGGSNCPAGHPRHRAGCVLRSAFCVVGGVANNDPDTCENTHKN